ncbi:MAG: carboxylating nicotinate-nucleotide diphosphorylase [Candidatus Gorgyraea atricola]|nr:carboxylating nicotinate-nucleotide diphosphorylase [Candidatus Gorgyraea atricola]
MKPVREKILPIIMAALGEDVGGGDITSGAIFEKDMIVLADIVAKEECVLCGIDVAKWVFTALDERIIFRSIYNDGATIKKGKKIASIKGPVKNILTCERTALNFLSRLSGVSTLTAEFVEKIKKTKAKIFDTRKTMPGMRVLEKYAVRVGGGSNHRMGLWDQVLIKDNHLSLCSIEDAVARAKNKHYKNIEVEVDNLGDFKKALASGADIIMLDNMTLEDIRKATRLGTSNKRQGTRVMLEVSGGINLENVAKIARTGVDRISIGALTHSAPSVDFSLEINV